MARIERMDVQSDTLRHLAQTLQQLSGVHKQLATGSRLNAAGDGPAALVAAERLLARGRELARSIEGTQRTGDLFRAAEGVFTEASGILSRARSLAVEAADGTLPFEARQLLQDEMDSALNSLGRIANSANFAGTRLTSGASDFSLGNVADEFRAVRIRQARLPEDGATLDVQVDVTAAAASARSGGAISAAQAGDATFEVSGALGSAAVTVVAGATRADVAQAINAVSDVTGVSADETTGVITSAEVGSSQFARIRNLEGTLSGVDEGKSFGTDVAGTVGGVAAAGNGNTLTVNGPNGLAGEITLDAGTGPGTYAFQITGGGVNLPGSQGNLRVAFPSILPEDLGLREAPAGLRSLASGGANTLLANPAGAGRIIESAIEDLARARGSLGGIDRGAIESSLRQLAIQFENTEAARSRIADTDYAQATAEKIQAEVRYKAQIALLRQSHQLAAQQVLSLLGG